MKNNQKMFLIQNLDDLSEVSAKFNTSEYEILTDAFVVGKLSFGPYDLSIWEFGVKREGENRKLCLRIKEKILENNEWADTATKDGYYHGGGIAEEIVALSSLALHGRFILGPVVRYNDTPQMFSWRYGYIDESLIKGEKEISAPSQFFELVKGLKVEYHLKFILAVRLYHQALLIIEDQPDIAYLNLVSSIETLSQDYLFQGEAPSKIDENLANLIKTIENESLRNEIEVSLKEIHVILKRDGRIGKRFVSFIIEYTDNSFWTRDDRPENGKIDPSQFENILKRIYDQRSKYLHTGELFQKSIYFSPVANAEMDGAIRMMSKGKSWEQKGFIPYPHFFEKLVNHVLLNFLKQNQI